MTIARLNLAYFFRGRQPLWTFAACWVTVILASLVSWNMAIEIPGAPNSALLSARLTIPLVGLITHLWLAAPQMPSWDVIGSRRVRRMSLALVVSGAILLPMAVLLTVDFVTRAPPSWVPGYFPGADDLGEVRWPLVWNAVLLSGVTVAAFALLGRSIGTAVAILVYGALICLGASSEWHHVTPYFSHAFGIGTSSHPIAAVFAFLAAVAIWQKTNGLSSLARRVEHLP